MSHLIDDVDNILLLRRHIAAQMIRLKAEGVLGRTGKFVPRYKPTRKERRFDGS